MAKSSRFFVAVVVLLVTKIASAQGKNDTSSSVPVGPSCDLPEFDRV